MKSRPFQIPKVKFLKVDLTSRDSVSAVIKGMDIVIQAAATTSGVKDTIYRPFHHVTDNAVMNSLIFRSTFEHKISNLIFFSCTTMYRSSDAPIQEGDFDANGGVPEKYFGVGWTKIYLEKMCEFYSKLGSTKFTAIRHSNIYGPYDKFDLDHSHVFGATLAKVMTADDGGKITAWGTGEEKRDLLYISDLTDFVDRIIRRQNLPFELVNAGGGAAISIKELVQKIILHSGKKLTVQFDASKPSVATNVCLDIARAQAVFGWSPQVTLDAGIKKTMKWYLEKLQDRSRSPFSKQVSER